MVKHTFIYLIVVVLVGATAWLLFQKSKNISDDSRKEGLAGLVASVEPTPSNMNEKENSTSKVGDLIKLPNGLQLQDTVVGYGKEAREGDVISAHYSGTLANGKKFDSSYDRGEPFSFVLGGGMVIKGWDLGIVGMKVGGKRKLIIPPDLGYGANGFPPIIPKSAILKFEVEMLKIN